MATLAKSLGKSKKGYFWSTLEPGLEIVFPRYLPPDLGGATSIRADRNRKAWVEKLEKQRGASYTRYMHNEIGVCIFQEVKKI